MDRAATLRLAGLALSIGLAACGGTPTGTGDDPPVEPTDPVDWTGVDPVVVEDTPLRIPFRPGERVRSGRLDSVGVVDGDEVIGSVEMTDRELVIVPAPDAHGPFTLRAYLTGSTGSSTSEREGRVVARTDVGPVRLVRATPEDVARASGALRVTALGDGRTLGSAAAGPDGLWPGVQLTENRRHLVLRAITVAGGTPASSAVWRWRWSLERTWRWIPSSRRPRPPAGAGPSTAATCATPRTPTTTAGTE